MSYETDLQEIFTQVTETSEQCEKDAWDRLDSLTKPPRSLGRLEQIAARVARIQGTLRPDVDYRAIIVAAGDHGVVSEGISPYPQDVTWQMVANFVNGGAAINQLAAAAEAELWVVDVGVAHDLTEFTQVRHEKIAQGTANMTGGPAMSREQCAQAVLKGISLAEEASSEDIRLVGTGEMGIGNTTSAAALTAAFTKAAIEDVVGPGTGLDEAGVLAKRKVVAAALEINEVNQADGLGILAGLGGFEIACLAGVVVGCARHGVPVVCDGFISTAAALAAVRMCPTAADYLIASHRSPEPGHTVLLDALGLDPLLELEMRLGEGTGAALAFPIVDAACRMLSGMATFDEAGVTKKAE